MKKIIIIIIILLFVSGVAIAADNKIKADKKNKSDKYTTLSKTISGKSDITSDLLSKSNINYHNTIMSYTSTELKKQKYPNEIKNTSNETITIQSYIWSDERNAYGYTISCTRDGYEIPIDNPIWIYNPPYEVTISVETDTKTKEEKVTTKEDPVGAINEFFINYCGIKPIDKSKKIKE